MPGHVPRLIVRRREPKLVVFVPREALDDVRDALFAAGAGRIGDYERCSLVHGRDGDVLRAVESGAGRRRARA